MVPNVAAGGVPLRQMRPGTIRPTGGASLALERSSRRPLSRPLPPKSAYPSSSPARLLYPILRGEACA